MASDCDLFDRVRRAFVAFLKDNRDLLTVDANERSISHKIAECLQREFGDLIVDCEYNRKGDCPKTLENLFPEGIEPGNLEAKTVFPDIVVHRRGSQEDNVMVIEIKKSSSRRSYDKDIKKLIAFTSPQYNYQIGLFLAIGVSGTAKPFSDVRCFRKGSEETSSVWAGLEDIGYGE